jgi:uncharacterized heparinase superfamily protein
VLTVRNALRYWNTLRHLKPRQIYGRVWFRLVRPPPDGGPPPTRRQMHVGLIPRPPKPMRMVGPSTFQFLNQTHEIRTPEDWNASAVNRLWLYNLHYFEDLSGVDSRPRTQWHTALIGRWIDENPPAEGCGWEPYPTSLRLVNWIVWALEGNAVPPGFDESLATQARWLAKRVEYHLAGNHLLANAKGLIVAGLFFSGAEADLWRSMGLRILARELNEQILADGGHFELSPMYHALVLEDLLDLVNIADVYRGVVDEVVLAAWRITAIRMLDWATAMSHPDGEVAFFNDSAFLIARTPAALLEYADSLRIPRSARPAALDDSGYIRVDKGVAVLIADFAEVGAGYQPGHAHADALSFELSLEGQRVLVNSGTSTYEIGEARKFERSTAAHNTVVVDDVDSSEVWSTFRVARRAHPLDISTETIGGDVVIRGAHDGYRRLRGKPTHHREFRIADVALIVTDRIVGTFTSARAHFYLHPNVTIASDNRWLLPNGIVCTWSVRGGLPQIVSSVWHPEFGRAEASRCLEVVMDGNELVFELRWGRR